MQPRNRKVIIYAIAAASLTTGLGLSFYATIGVVFPAFATALSAITTAVVVGNVGEHLAGKKAS